MNHVIYRAETAYPQHNGLKDGEPHYYYPNEFKTIVDIDNIQNFSNAIAYDNMFSHFTGDKYKYSREGNATFVTLNVYVIDIDNTHSENPEDWVGINEFIRKYKEWDFYIVTSKSHNIEKIDEKTKDVSSPRPRYHIYFLLDEEILDESKVPKTEKVKSFDESFDAAALGAKRFFYASPNAEIHENKGSRGDIVGVINSTKTKRQKTLQSWSKNTDVPDWHYYDDWVEGNTTAALKTFVTKQRKRGLSKEEIKILVEAGFNKMGITHKDIDYEMGPKGIITWAMKNIDPAPNLKDVNNDESFVVEIMPGKYVHLTEEDFKAKYSIVNYVEFSNNMNEKYKKTLYKNRDAIWDMKEEVYYEIKQIAKLYQKEVIEKSDFFVNAFVEWEKRTETYKRIEHSVVHKGEKIIDGEKVLYILDEQAAKRVQINPSPSQVYNVLNNSAQNYVPTTYSLDGQMGGGFIRGSSYGIEGRTGLAKSMWAENISLRLATAYDDPLRKKMNVFYFDSENGEYRFWKRAIHMYYDIDRASSSSALFKIQSEKNNIFKNLSYHIMPSFALNTNNLMEAIKTHNIKPDLIVIDLMDHLAASKSVETWWKELEVISADTTRLAMELDCVVFNILQSNSEGVDKDGLVERNAGTKTISGGVNKIKSFSAFWQMYNEWGPKYRGLANTAKSRDFINDPKDIYLEFKPSGRMEELTQKPQNIVQAAANISKKEFKEIRD